MWPKAGNCRNCCLEWAIDMDDDWAKPKATVIRARCPRCKVRLRLGKAIVPTIRTSEEGTSSYGPGVYKDVWKCPQCGFSKARIP